MVSARADRAEHTANLVGVIGRLLMMPGFWFSLALVLCVAFFPNSVAAAFRNHIRPSDHQLFKVGFRFRPASQECQLFARCRVSITSSAVLIACLWLQELELTLPPFALVPNSEHFLVPMVSLPNGKVQTISSEQEHGSERFQMVSE